MKPLCIAIHDVAPATWPLCVRLREAVREVAPHAPVTLLVVPNYHEYGDDAPAPYLAWLRESLLQGDEIALHGYTHCDTRARGWLRRVYTAGEGEFAALTHAEATRRIARGRLWCASHGLRVRGFVAPAWLLSADARRALYDFDFEYTTTLTRFIALRDDAQCLAPSVAYSTRSGLRRGVSRLWNRALIETGAPLLRVALHPADARHERILRHAKTLISSTARRREPVTKHAFSQRLVMRRVAAATSTANR